MKKTIFIISALAFGVWMLLVHEPRDLVSSEMMGVVTALPPSKGDADMLRVELEDGRTVTVEKPAGMPSRIGIGVRMEVYQSRWFAEHSYQVRNWKLN